MLVVMAPGFGLLVEKPCILSGLADSRRMHGRDTQDMPSIALNENHEPGQ